MNLAAQAPHPERSAEALAAWHQARWRPWSRSLARQACRLLLSSGHWSLLARSTVLGWHDPRSQALARHLLTGPDDSATPWAAPGDPVPQAAWVCMAKNEADILLVNLLWHYRLGLRRFLLLDNDSDDATLATVQHFMRWHPDAEVHIEPDPEVAHRQGPKMTQAARLAMQRWPALAWLFMLDADEFLCTRAPLVQVLKELPVRAQALLLPKAIYRPRQLAELEPDAPFWQRLTQRSPLGAVSCKVAMRADPTLSVGQGNHEVEDAQGRLVRRWAAHPALSLREFPTRSLPQFRRKAVQGAAAIEAAQAQGFKGVGGQHWTTRQQVWQTQGDAGLQRLLQQTMQREQRGPGVIDPMPLHHLFTGLRERLPAPDLTELDRCLALTHSA